MEGLEVLYERDKEHDDTTTSQTYPDAVAIEAGRLYVYPMFAGTIIIENYIRKPNKLVSRGSLVDLPYDRALNDLLISGICKRGFRWLHDYDLLKFHTLEFDRLLNLYNVHKWKSDSRFRKSVNSYHVRCGRNSNYY